MRPPLKLKADSPTLPASVSELLIKIFGQQGWDWIIAQMPTQGQKPDWRTVNRGLLRPQGLVYYWQDIKRLVGVRFSKKTFYALLDIDFSSSYRSVERIREIREVLEKIGIVRTILIRSSSSLGLHLYIPLPEKIKTFNFAAGLRVVLENQGFLVRAGELEIFPNTKAYASDGTFSLYNAHRLPLQPGSGACLLDDDLNPIGDSLETFFNMWQTSAKNQDVKRLKRYCWKARAQFKKRRNVCSKSSEGSNEYNVSPIEAAWTGAGQTNELIGRVARYGRTSLNLTGRSLRNFIIQTVEKTPGYKEFCNHIPEIEKRADDWAKCVERNYKGSCLKRTRKTGNESKVNKNQLKADETKVRIIAAVRELKESGCWPETILRRVEALDEHHGIGRSTLYMQQYLPYWHPEHWVEEVTAAISDELQITAEMPPFEKNYPSTAPSNPCPAKEFHTFPPMKLISPYFHSAPSASQKAFSRLPIVGPSFFEKNEPKGDQGAPPFLQTQGLPPVGPLGEHEQRKLLPPLPLPCPAEKVTQLSIVPEGEVTAATPELLTRKLRALKRQAVAARDAPI